MGRSRVFLLVPLALCAVVASGSGSAATGSASLPTLSGRVGPGKAISLKNGGALVATLPAATYKVTVKDASKADNFHLLGFGVNKRTGVAFLGTRTWTVSFEVGKTYTYRSDAHPKLRRTFKVLGKVQPPPPPVGG